MLDEILGAKPFYDASEAIDRRLRDARDELVRAEPPQGERRRERERRPDAAEPREAAPAIRPATPMVRSPWVTGPPRPRDRR